MNLDSQMCLRAFFLSKDLTKLEQTYYWSSVSTMFINSYDQAWQMRSADRNKCGLVGRAGGLGRRPLHLGSTS